MLDKTFCASSKIDNLFMSSPTYFLVRTGTSILNLQVIITVNKSIDVSGFKNPILVEPGGKIPMEMSKPDDRNFIDVDASFFKVPESDVEDLGNNKWACASNFIPESGYRYEQESMKLLAETDHLLMITPKIGSCDIFIKFVCTIPEK